MTDLLHQWVQQHRRLQNYLAASRELKLTPQEQYAYQHHLHNLGLGGVPHDNGSISSYLGTSVGFDDNKTYMLPTVWDNKVVDLHEAIRRAREVGLDKFPSYDSVDAAEARYQDIHRYMERDTGRKLNARTVQQYPGANNTGTVEGAQPTSPSRQHRRPGGILE